MESALGMSPCIPWLVKDSCAGQDYVVTKIWYAEEMSKWSMPTAYENKFHLKGTLVQNIVLTKGHAKWEEKHWLQTGKNLPVVDPQLGAENHQ